MPRLDRFGDIIAGVGEVKPTTVELLQQGRELESQEGYRRSQMGLLGMRIAAELKKLDQPLMVPPGTSLLRPGEKEPYYTAPSAAAFDKQDLERRRSAALDIAGGPLPYEEKLRQIGRLGMEPGNFLIKPGTPAGPSFRDTKIIDDLTTKLGRPPTPGEYLTEESKFAGTRAGEISYQQLLAQMAAFSPEAVEGMVSMAVSTGQDPSMGFGPAIRAKYFEGLQRRVQQLGGWETFASGRALLRSMQTSLSALERQRGLIEAFMRTNDKNLALAEKISDSVSRSDVPALNRLLLPFRLQVSGAEDVAALNAAIRIAVNETARVLTSATGAGVLSDTARQELEELLNKEMTPTMVKRVIGVFRQDMVNRQTSYDDQRAQIQETIRTANPGTTGAVISPTTPAPGRVPAERLPDPKGLKEGQTAGGGKYIIRNKQWQLNQQ